MVVEGTIFHAVCQTTSSLSSRPLTAPSPLRRQARSNAVLRRGIRVSIHYPGPDTSPSAPAFQFGSVSPVQNIRSYNALGGDGRSTFLIGKL